MVRPTLFDELAIAAPINLHGHILAQSVIDDSIPPSSYASCCSDLENRFDAKKCRMAVADEVAPFAPRVYVEGEPCPINMHCAPFEFYLLGDLKNKFHGFACDDLGLQPSVGKQNTSLEVPMSDSIMLNNDIAMIRPGHSIFAKAFSKRDLKVDLPLILKFVIEHGASNRARDGAT